MVFFIKHFVWTRLLKMILLNKKIDIFLKLLEHYYFICRFQNIFWADAISTAYFLINRMPSSIFYGETPFSVLFSNKLLFPIEPRIFGCTCFVRDVHPQVTKLDPKSLKCIFLGYSRM